jgi:type II secretory pathway component GspD/PulD (secretin)
VTRAIVVRDGADHHAQILPCTAADRACKTNFNIDPRRRRLMWSKRACLALAGFALSNALDAAEPPAASGATPGTAAPVTAPAAPIARCTDSADIGQILTDFAQRANKRLIVDPRVRAYVCTPGIDLRKATYRDLQAILRVHGFVAMDEQNVITVVPEANMRQLPPTTLEGDSRNVGDDDIVLKVVTVQKIEAAQLVPILRPLMPQAAHLAAFAPTNSLIIAGRYANVRSIEAIARSLDKQPPRTLPFPPPPPPGATENRPPVRVTPPAPEPPRDTP